MDIFSTFFNMKVCRMFSLEPPHRDDSNEYIQYTVFKIKRKSPSIISNQQLWDNFPRDSRASLKQPLTSRTTEVLL